MNTAGIQKHHEKYLAKMDSLELPGCFGMTELGHGSNVMGIETQARYDASTGEFVLNTPSDEASKYWIGGAAQHGKVRRNLHVWKSVVNWATVCSRQQRRPQSNASFLVTANTPNSLTR